MGLPEPGTILHHQLRETVNFSAHTLVLNFHPEELYHNTFLFFYILHSEVVRTGGLENT